VLQPLSNANFDVPKSLGITCLDFLTPMSQLFWGYHGDFRQQSLCRPPPSTVACASAPSTWAFTDSKAAFQLVQVLVDRSSHEREEQFWE